MSTLNFTKDWDNTDNGTVPDGQDLGDIQNDLVTWAADLGDDNVGASGFSDDALANNARPSLFFADALAPDEGFVATGLTEVSNTDLTITIAAGRAYIMKTSASPDILLPVSPGQQVVTLEATKDNYVDLLADGTYQVNAVTNGGTEPSISTDGTRIIKAVTDATSVTSTTDLRGTEIFPAFRFRKSGNQVVTSTASGEEVTWETTDWDTHNRKASDTYLIPSTGVWHLRAQVLWLSTTDQDTPSIVIEDPNDASNTFIQANITTSGTTLFTAMVSGNILLDRGDTIRVRAAQTTGTDKSISSNRGATFFEGRLLYST